MKQYLYIIIMCVTILLFASCGPQYDAEDLVENFMEQNMREEMKPSAIRFTDIDSTTFVNDSVIISLRHQARRAQRYRPDVKYAPDQPFKKLIVTRVTYRVEDQEYNDTYYLDMDLTRVVAYKEN